MFYVPLHYLVDPAGSVSWSEFKNDFHQVNPVFMKLDETTGKAREVTINDDLILLGRANTTNTWIYNNLKDIEFYYDSYTKRIFTRYPNDMFAFSIASQTSTILRSIPESTLINDLTTGEKLWTWRKIIDVNTKELIPIYHTNYDYYNGFVLVNKLAEKMITAMQTYINNISGKTAGSFSAVYLLNDGKLFYSFVNAGLLTDTLEPDNVVTNSTDIYNYKNNGTNIIGKNSPFYINANPSLLPIDRFFNIAGKDSSGKFNLYTLKTDDYNFVMNTFTHIYKPIQDIGMFFVIQNQSTCQISNYFLTYYRNKNGGKEPYHFSLIKGKDRSFCQRHDNATKLQLTDFMTYIELDKDSNDLILTNQRYTKYDCYLYKAQLHRTPKNLNLDYSAPDFIEPVSNSFHNRLTKDGVFDGTMYCYQKCVVVQKGYTDKSFIKDEEGFFQAQENNSANDNKIEGLNGGGFKDIEIFQNINNNTKLYGYVSKDDYDTATKETILVDSVFNHYNNIFKNAPIFLVDTNIFKTFGITDYEKYMPYKCIIFEVDDLYLYDADGKIEKFNPKYIDVDNNREFIYDLYQFDKFKVRYMIQTQEVVWDTKLDTKLDFNRTNIDNKIYAYYSNDVSTFLTTLWLPYRNAVIRLYGITLNTNTGAD